MEPSGPIKQAKSDGVEEHPQLTLFFISSKNWEQNLLRRQGDIGLITNFFCKFSQLAEFYSTNYPLDATGFIRIYLVD